jgi:hypothetical protein
MDQEHHQVDKGGEHQDTNIKLGRPWRKVAVKVLQKAMAGEKDDRT